MNEELQHPFIDEKVQEALHKMALMKSLGPNGFSAYFYQTYWPIVGKGVSKVVLTFLNDRIVDNCINFTYIVLIPKIKNPILLVIFAQ